MINIKLPRWFHQLGSPKWFYEFAGRIQIGLAILALVLLSWGMLWALLYAPEDYQQGNSFRIIYVHVLKQMQFNLLWIRLIWLKLM